jgi:hypothetical protein
VAVAAIAFGLRGWCAREDAEQMLTPCMKSVMHFAFCINQVGQPSFGVNSMLRSHRISCTLGMCPRFEGHPQSIATQTTKLHSPANNHKQQNDMQIEQNPVKHYHMDLQQDSRNTL